MRRFEPRKTGQFCAIRSSDDPVRPCAVRLREFASQRRRARCSSEFRRSICTRRLTARAEQIEKLRGLPLATRELIAVRDGCARVHAGLLAAERAQVGARERLAHATPGTLAEQRVDRRSPPRGAGRAPAPGRARRARRVRAQHARTGPAHAPQMVAGQSARAATLPSRDARSDCPPVRRFGRAAFALAACGNPVPGQTGKRRRADGEPADKARRPPSGSRRSRDAAVRGVRASSTGC